MNTINPYAVNPNQPKTTGRRAYLIFKLERDCPAMRLGLRNGRSLNRLSTKQLEAKVRQMVRVLDAATNKYTDYLDSIQELSTSQLQAVASGRMTLAEARA